MTRELLPGINHPDVIKGRVPNPYSADLRWRFDLDELSLPMQRTATDLKSWLRPEQDWEFEAFRDSLTAEDNHDLSFVFYSDHPPLNIVGVFRRRQVLRLPEVFASKTRLWNKGYGAGGAYWTHFEFSVPEVGPFQRSTQTDGDSTGYGLEKVRVEPLVILDTNTRYEQDINRTVFKVSLENRSSEIQRRILARRQHLEATQRALAEAENAMQFEPADIAKLDYLQSLPNPF
jgi:hypothetical protein